MMIIRIILGAALVGSLFGAGWNVYRRLPEDGSWVRTEAYDTKADSEMTIILRSNSAAVGGDPARASRSEMFNSRWENAP